MRWRYELHETTCRVAECGEPLLRRGRRPPPRRLTQPPDAAPPVRSRPSTSGQAPPGEIPYERPDATLPAMSRAQIAPFDWDILVSYRSRGRGGHHAREARPSAVLSVSKGRPPARLNTSQAARAAVSLRDPSVAHAAVSEESASNSQLRCKGIRRPGGTGAASWHWTRRLVPAPSVSAPAPESDRAISCTEHRPTDHRFAVDSRPPARSGGGRGAPTSASTKPGQQPGRSGRRPRWQAAGCRWRR